MIGTPVFESGENEMARKGLFTLAALGLASLALAQDPTPAPIDWTKLTEREWSKRLTPNQFAILRRAATEPAGRNAYWNNHAEGTYVCAGCENVLFSSATKFESGTGWPSFYKPFAKTSVQEKRDPDGERAEVICARCKGHLGHVFNDATGDVRHSETAGRACATA